MKLSRLRKWLLIVTIFTLLLLATGYWYWRAFINTALIKEGNPVVLEIKPDTSVLAISNILFEKHLIPSRKHFLMLLKWEGHLRDLKAGVYQIMPGDTILDLIHKMSAGDVLKQPFRIINGSTLAQVNDHLKAAPWLKYSESDLQSIAGQYPTAEGLLLADTYYYGAGSNAKQMLKMANSNLLSLLEKTWSERQSDLPYKTSYELLIVASIIEKESAIPDERMLISGVVVNRLKKHMPLQMDPTVIYAMGASYNGKLTHNDLSIDSPYNTYRYRGLPPTPIAMVGKDALFAAAHPQASKYLYFVAKGDGTHSFSENYNEQKKAVNLYKASTR